MRTLYQTFGRVAVVLVLVLFTTLAWAQNTDTKVTYNASGTPAISKANAPVPTKNGQPVGVNRTQDNAAAGANQTLTPEAVEALKTKPAVSVAPNGEARFNQADVDAWTVSFQNWIANTPGAKASLSQEEYNLLTQNDYNGLYKHAYSSNPEAVKRSQAVK